MRKRIALFAALAALAAPVSLGLAGTGSSVTVPIQKHNNSCTWDGTHKNVGTARFVRNKDGSVTITVKYRGDAAGDIDPVYLYYDPGCTYLTTLGSFKVGSGGDGSRTYVVPASVVGGFHTLFLFLYSEARADYDRSDVAKI